MAFVLSSQQVAEYNALRRQVRELLRRLDALASDGPSNEFGVNWQHVQITDDTPDGDGNYAGKIVQPENGSWEEIATGLACKVRGGTLQTSKTYIGRMSHYDGADSVFVVADIPTVSGATVTVEIDDTHTPASYAGPLDAMTWQAFQVTGLTLGQYGTDYGLRLLPAGVTQQGAVSTGQQAFAGTKAFYVPDLDSVLFVGDSDFDGDTFDNLAKYIQLDPSNSRARWLGYVDDDNQTTVDFNFGNGSFATPLQILMTGVGSGSTYSASFTFALDGSDFGCTLEGPGYPYFAVVHSGVQLKGITASEAGLTIHGGLVTAFDHGDFCGGLAYSPTTSGDWNGTAPATIKAALDRLATLAKTLNGGIGP